MTPVKLIQSSFFVLGVFLIFSPQKRRCKEELWNAFISYLRKVLACCGGGGGGVDLLAICRHLVHKPFFLFFFFSVEQKL